VTPFDVHPDAVARPKRDERPRLDRRSGRETQAIPLCERRQHELRFDHRELVADALPGSGAEGQVRELGPGGHALGREAIGTRSVLGKMYKGARKAIDNVLTR
jgi:hypothetical protein